jgi:hypothetical protein
MSVSRDVAIRPGDRPVLDADPPEERIVAGHGFEHWTSKQIAQIAFDDRTVGQNEPDRSALEGLDRSDFQLGRLDDDLEALGSHSVVPPVLGSGAPVSGVLAHIAFVRAQRPALRR